MKPVYLYPSIGYDHFLNIITMERQNYEIVKCNVIGS